MRRVLAACLLTFSLAAASPATASDIILGLGGSTCGAWTAEWTKKKNPSATALAMVSWVLGYLQRADHQTPTLLTGQNASEFKTWLDGHCRDNPQDSLLTAATKLEIELLRRARERDPPAPAAPIVLPPAPAPAATPSPVKRKAAPARPAKASQPRPKAAPSPPRPPAPPPR